MKRTLRIAALIVLLALLATACSPKPSSNPPAGGPPTSGEGSGNGNSSAPPGTGIQTGTGGQTGTKTGGGAGEPKPIDLTKVKPNELGEIVILEYHGISSKEERWARQYENFRKDLESLYNQGYRLVKLTDVLENNIKVPAGFTPVVLTFDDGQENNFRYLVKDGKREIDRTSAVGIILDFAEAHPDMGTAATFYVNMSGSPFGQRDSWKDKLRFLVDNGMEIGNHTYDHVNLSQMTPEEIRKQMGLQQKGVDEAVPGYKENSFALPFGIWPKDREMAKRGEYQGTNYDIKGVLLVGSEPIPSPVDVKYDPYALQRVQAIQSELDRVFGRFQKHPEQRYISDGDPNTITFPSSLSARLNKAAVGNKTVRMY